jgi:hypothetical protein
MQNNSEQTGADLHEIRKTISTLHEPNTLVELCAIGNNSITSGYYSDYDALAREGKRLSDSGMYDGVYVTVNPVKPDVPKQRGIATNRMYEHGVARTRDEDIAKRCWFVLDIDPVREPQTSATNRQKGAASWCKTCAVGSLRRECGMPEPVIADSGNGYYALYRTHEPHNQDMDELFKNATKAAAAKFSMKDVAVIDPVTHNAARLIKLFGTMARKGPNTAKTPHRFSELGGVPKNLRTVTREQLQRLAIAAAPSKIPVRPNVSDFVIAAKVDELLKRAAITVKSVDDAADGSKKWVLAQCWFIPEHKDSAVFLYPDGVLAYRCFHRACGHNQNRWKEFRQAVEKKLGERFDFAHGGDIPYELTPEGIIHNTFTRSGDRIHKPLTNFSVRILTNIEADDGIETKHSLEIEAVVKGRKQQLTVPSSEFASMNWVIEKLGAEAIIVAGAGAKDHARAAIQYLSDDVHHRRVFTHTGWRHIGDEWLYLHADGAIGCDGLYDSVKVKLPQNLATFRLPAPPTGGKLETAVRASLRVLDVAPLSRTLPIYAGIWRAPLGDSDFSVHATGPTGTFKTSLCALAMQHYGAGFDALHVPGAWSSTANANAAMQFALKDALFLIDDFVPSGSPSDSDRKHKDADRIFRGQGNISGRARLGRDGISLGGSNPPRGLTLSTGEDVPRGQSLQSRLWLAEFAPGDVDVKKLTSCQGDAITGIYAAVMSAYLNWLAPGYARVMKQLPKQIEKFRDAAARSGQHARTPGIVANLMVGLSYFLRFATEVGALSADDAKVLRQEAWCALGRAAAAQTRGQAAEEPALRFLNLIAAALDRGDACMRDAENAAPSDKEKGRCVGWWTSDGLVLLEPESAYATAHQLSAQQGEEFPVRMKTLGKRLEDGGFLGSHDKNRTTTQVTIGTTRRRVWAIKKLDIFPSSEEVQLDEGPGSLF